jgi:hypothetical protein
MNLRADEIAYRDPEVSPSDENGVDLNQVEFHLSLTPAERLEHLWQFADFVFIIWESRGINWLDTEKFSNV